MNYPTWCLNRERELKKFHVFMVSGKTELSNIVVHDILDFFHDEADLNEPSATGKWKDIDDVLNQPLFKRQVVILRGIDLSPHRSRLISWIEDTGSVRDKRTILVLTAATARPKQVKEEGEESKKLEERWIPSEGNKYVSYIDCADIQADHLKKLVLSYLPQATEGAADKLIQLCKGDVTNMLHEMKKLKAYPSVDEARVATLVVPIAEDDVVEALFAGHIMDVLQIDPGSVNMRHVVSAATERSRQHLNLFAHKGKNLHGWEMSKKADVPLWLFPKRMEEVDKLTQEQIWKRLILLREIDQLICGGCEIGVLHYLAQRWDT